MRPGAEDALERALNGLGDAQDEDTAELAETARRLESAFMVEPPRARRERAVFVMSAAARQRSFSIMRVAAPAVAAAAVMVLFVAFVSRTAVPGQTLYPVRQAILGPSVEQQIDNRIDTASATLDQAQAALQRRAPELAESRVKTAQNSLANAAGLLDDLDEGRARRAAMIERLDERAIRIFANAADQQARLSENRGPGENRGPSENRGPGENSGPGGDDDGTSDQGPGDNSGPGGGDDSSGKGSGGDSSGSGSSGSGSTSHSGGSDDDPSRSDTIESGIGTLGGSSATTTSSTDDSSGSGSGSDDSSSSGTGSDD